MPKIYEITAFVIDKDDKYTDGEACALDLLNESTGVRVCAPVQHMTVEFEWDDSASICRSGCTVRAAREFMARCWADYTLCHLKEDPHITRLLCERMEAQNARNITRCKNCRHRGRSACPMYYDPDDYRYDEDRTIDDGFCDKGEPKE